MGYVVLKFDKTTKEWIEIKIFSRKKSAQRYIGQASKDGDEMYCIEEKGCVRSEHARII